MPQIKERAGMHVFGQVRLYRTWDDGLVQPLSSRHNQIQVSWGQIAAMTIGLGRKEYRIGGLYIEYENVVSPDDVVTPPVYGATDGLEYFNDLSLSSTRDYLRVPLIQDPMLGIVTGYEDFFVAGETGNKLTFFSQTQGTAGVHGKPFSAGANSKVIGAALVAIPTFQDATQDVIFARTYFDMADQALKLASSQISIAWDINFPLPD